MVLFPGFVLHIMDFIYVMWQDSCYRHTLTHWGQDKMAAIFADDIFKCILLNENVWISIKVSLKFVAKVRINNIPALVQIMAWRRTGDKPLSEPMMVILWMHICITRPQWVNSVDLGIISPWTKWLPFRRRQIQMHFREWKVLNFDKNFT